MSNKQTLIVIGNGMVGQNFLVSLMANDIKDNYTVVTFCEEAIPAYDRVHLSEYFAGKSADDLSLVEDGFFDDNNITIHMGDKASSIDRTNKTVTSEKRAGTIFFVGNNLIGFENRWAKQRGQI